jgi:hypothetical protein
MLLYFVLRNGDERKVFRADDVKQFCFLGFQGAHIASIELRFTAASPSDSETVTDENVCILAEFM